jgi:starch-binding outer membrane protein, SusD/RagB family
MKKIINYILATVLLAGFTSCGNDWLDLTPTTSVATSSALSTKDGIKTALNGVYSLMAAHWFYGDRIVMYPEVKGEDMQSVSTSSRPYAYYSLTSTPEDEEISSCWNLGYQVIHNANNIIAAIKANFSTSDTDIANYLAQAYALRGWTLFQLTNMYSQAYAVNSGALGACIITEDDDVSYMPFRNTVTECYAQVISDLKAAISGGLPTTATLGYINKWGAEGLLSRVYLYMQDYTNALAYAKDVITNASSVYSLVTNANYATYWGSKGGAETIFELYRSATENVGADCVQTICNWNGYAGMILSKNYLDLLDQDANDVRHCFTNTGTSNYYTKYNGVVQNVWLTKYCGTGTVSAPASVQYNDIYVLRLSELYLTAAECEYRLNGATSSAVSYINAIVTRANPNKSLAASDLSVNRILEERRRELVGEGVGGLYDILRTRSASSTIDHASGWNIGTLTYPTPACNFFRITAPIPSLQMNNDKNTVQNEGY